MSFSYLPWNYLPKPEFYLQQTNLVLLLQFFCYFSTTKIKSKLFFLNWVFPVCPTSIIISLDLNFKLGSLQTIYKAKMNGWMEPSKQIGHTLSHVLSLHMLFLLPTKLFSTALFHSTLWVAPLPQGKHWRASFASITFSTYPQKNSGHPVFLFVCLFAFLFFKLTTNICRLWTSTLHLCIQKHLRWPAHNRCPVMFTWVKTCFISN